MFHRILVDSKLNNNPEDLFNTVLLCGNLDDLKIGHALISNAICDAIGCKRKTLSAAYQRGADAGDGDLGNAAAALVAASGRGRQTTLNFGNAQSLPRPLRVGEIVSSLRRLSSFTGNGSRASRQGLLASLFRRCDCCKSTLPGKKSSIKDDCSDSDFIKLAYASWPELRFLVRTCVDNLRIHATNVTILSAVARACVAFHTNSKLYLMFKLNNSTLLRRLHGTRTLVTIPLDLLLRHFRLVESWLYTNSRSRL